MAWPLQDFPGGLPEYPAYAALEPVEDVLRREWPTIPGFWDLADVPDDLLLYRAHTLFADMYSDGVLGADVDRQLITHGDYFHNFRGTPASLDRLGELTGYGAAYVLYDSNDVAEGPDVWTRIDIYLLRGATPISTTVLEYLQRAYRRLLPVRLTTVNFFTILPVGTSAHLTPGFAQWSVSAYGRTW